VEWMPLKQSPWALRQTSCWHISWWIPSTNNPLGLCWSHFTTLPWSLRLIKTFGCMGMVQHIAECSEQCRHMQTDVDVPCEHVRTLSLNGSMKVSEGFTAVLCTGDYVRVHECQQQCPGWMDFVHGTLTSTSPLLVALTCRFCCTACGWLLLCHTFNRPYSLTALGSGLIWTVIVCKYGNKVITWCRNVLWVIPVLMYDLVALCFVSGKMNTPKHSPLVQKSPAPPRFRAVLAVGTLHQRGDILCCKCCHLGN
jgi:hypothetical protein